MPQWQLLKISIGVWQGCPLSPTLFNICVNQIITEWKEEETKGIKTSRNEDIKTILFTDDQVAVVDPECAADFCTSTWVSYKQIGTKNFNEQSEYSDFERNRSSEKQNCNK